MHALAPTMPADLRALFESLGLTAQGERPHGERLLERLLDLKRCVELGRVLDAPQPAESIGPEQLEQQVVRMRLLQGNLLAALRDTRVEIDQRFIHWTRAAPDAVALHALLVERIGSGAPSTVAAAARSVAAQVTPRYIAVVTDALQLILKQLGARQNEVRRALQQGNSEMQRLAALDRVIDGVFRTELEQCRIRLQESLGEKLEKQMHAACAALPEGAGVGEMRPWFGPGGCIGQFLHDGRRVCHAFLDLEWSALMGLVQAAVQAAGPAPDAANPPEDDES